MGDLSRRIAVLPPERRALVEQLSGKSAHARPAPLPPPAAAIATAAAAQDSRAFYDAINRQLNSTAAGDIAYFLNYGYVPCGGVQYSQQSVETRVPEHACNKNSIRLVLELIGDCDLKNKRVLDAACGRGGTVHVMRQFFEPASIVAFDLSSEAVRFCRRTHRYPNTWFLECDAQKLPFTDDSFDVITNVESSHSYPARAEFYSEISRVLSSGGRFLYTDLLTSAEFAEGIRSLIELGLEVERNRDISRSVLLSCDQMAERNLQAFSGGDPNVLNDFLATPGSQVYEGLRCGSAVYRMLALRKGSHAS